VAIATAILGQANNFWTNEELAGILSGAAKVPVGDGYCAITVVGEQGKINVNGLKSPNGQLVRPRVDQMLRLIDVLNAQYAGENPIGYGVVPAIIDWTDPDEEVTVLPFVRGESTGAENDYYQRLEKPIHCKNGPFDVLGELTLVKGMSREAFWGTTAADGSAPVLGMEPFLTVYGDGRLDINQASANVLRTISDFIDTTMAEAIVQNRPYGSLRELSRIPGMTPEVLQAIQETATVRSQGAYYTVTVRGVAGNCVRTVRVVVERDRFSGECRCLIRWET
jgi:general secretion pathway protein K